MQRFEESRGQVHDSGQNQATCPRDSELDKDFDAEAFFNDYYGVYRDEKTPPQQVVIRATDEERPYLRDLPLHHSQKEIRTTADYSDFAYFLSPSDDFIAEILRDSEQPVPVIPNSTRTSMPKLSSTTIMVSTVTKRHRPSK